MNKRAVLTGLFLWLCLIGPIISWSGNPVLRPPGKTTFNVTVEETARAFPIRMVPLPKPTSPPKVTPPKPGAKTTPATVRFNYETWSWQESRRRVIVGFIAWCAAGVLIQWLMARVFRDKAN